MGYQLNSKEMVTDAIDIICKYNVNHCVMGIGFNCTHPIYIDGLLRLAKQCMAKNNIEFILIVYANSGEEWDAVNKKWNENTTMTDEQYAEYAVNWYKSGANIIGGCCRTTPDTIKTLKQTIMNSTRQRVRSLL